MFSERINNIFEKIRLKTFSYDDVNEQFTPDEMEGMNIAFAKLEDIENLLKNTCVQKSKLAKFIFHFRNSLKTDRRSRRDINKIKDNDIKQFVNLIYAYFDKVANEEAVNKLYDKLIAFIHAKFPKEADQKNIEVELICSVFFDYKTLKEIKNLWLNLNLNFKNEFLGMMEDFKELINNGAELWGESEADFIHKTAVFYKSKTKVSKIVFMRTMVKGLFDSINPIKVLNENVLDNSITKECLTELLALITEFSFDDLENHELNRLKPLFLKLPHLSIRSKQLILHDIFLLFGHPSAMSEQDKDNLLGKVDKRIRKDTEQMKTRMIERLVGELE